MSTFQSRVADNWTHRRMLHRMDPRWEAATCSDCSPADWRWKGGKEQDRKDLFHPWNRSWKRGWREATWTTGWHTSTWIRQVGWWTVGPAPTVPWWGCRFYVRTILYFELCTYSFCCSVRTVQCLGVFGTSQKQIRPKHTVNRPSCGVGVYERRSLPLLIICRCNHQNEYPCPCWLSSYAIHVWNSSC